MSTATKEKPEQATTQEEKKQPPRMFTREALLGMERPTKVVQPPGFDGAVEIRALTAWEQSEFQSSLVRIEYRGSESVATPTMIGSDSRLCAIGVSAPVMNQKEWGQLPNRLVSFIALEIRKLSGMEVAVEEAEGN